MPSSRVEGWEFSVPGGESGINEIGYPPSESEADTTGLDGVSVHSESASASTQPQKVRPCLFIDLSRRVDESCTRQN